MNRPVAMALLWLAAQILPAVLIPACKFRASKFTRSSNAIRDMLISCNRYHPPATDSSNWARYGAATRPGRAAQASVKLT